MDTARRTRQSWPQRVGIIFRSSRQKAGPNKVVILALPARRLNDGRKDLVRVGYDHPEARHATVLTYAYQVI